MSDLWVIFALIFAAASLAIYGVYWIFVFNRREHKTINRRLDLAKSLDSAVVLQTLLRERGFRNETNPVLRQFGDWLTQTGVPVERKSLVLAFLALCVAWILIFSQMLGIGLAALVLAVLAAAGVMILYLARKRSQRIVAFTEQLPDAIDIIVRGVRVGLPFSSAITLVAREMADPIGTEFGILADEVTFGLNAKAALENLYRRVGQEDLLFLTISLSVQNQTGGNIGEILGRLSSLMRRRAAMRLKVKALSAEGRLSGLFLSGLPILLLLVISFFSPKYYDPILSSQILKPAIFLGLFLLIVGNVIMYRMVNFKY